MLALQAEHRTSENHPTGKRKMSEVALSPQLFEQGKLALNLMIQPLQINPLTSLRMIGAMAAYLPYGNTSSYLVMLVFSLLHPLRTCWRYEWFLFRSIVPLSNITTFWCLFLGPRPCNSGSGFHNCSSWLWDWRQGCWDNSYTGAPGFCQVGGEDCCVLLRCEASRCPCKGMIGLASLFTQDLSTCIDQWETDAFHSLTISLGFWASFGRWLCL